MKLKINNDNKVIGKYATYKIKDNECLIINGRYFNNPWDLQRYRFFRRSMGFSSWDNIAKEGVKVFELIGGGVQ